MATPRGGGHVAVVIDNGSHTLRAGLASGSAPSLVTPSIVASPGGQQLLVSRWKGRVGLAAERKRSSGAYIRPIIEQGVIQDEQAMVKLWEAVFDELKVDLSEHPVMITEPFYSTGTSRERVMELMFEQCGVARMYLAKEEPLVLYSMGQTTGLVLNCGNDNCSIVPVHESLIQISNCYGLPVGGHQLNKYLWRLLSRKHMHLTPTPQHEIVEEIKEKCCYVAKSFKEEMNRNVRDIELGFNIEDSGPIRVDRERFQCPEALFDPQLVGSMSPGLHLAVRNVIGQFSDDIISTLYSQIVYTGGCTAFPGFKSRLHAELAAVAPPLYRKRIVLVAPPSGTNSTWKGGAILSKMASFQEMWVTRDQYMEQGAAIVHKLCQS